MLEVVTGRESALAKVAEPLPNGSATCTTSEGATHHAFDPFLSDPNPIQNSGPLLPRSPSRNLGKVY